MAVKGKPLGECFTLASVRGSCNNLLELRKRRLEIMLDNLFNFDYIK